MNTYRAKQDVPVHSHACPVLGAPDRLAGSFRYWQHTSGHFGTGILFLCELDLLWLLHIFRYTPFRPGPSRWRRRRLSQVQHLSCCTWGCLFIDACAV